MTEQATDPKESENESRPESSEDSIFRALIDKDKLPDSAPESIKLLPETLDFKPGINLIVGSNASGKSTLLEAMWLASGLLRQYKREELSRKMGDGEAIRLRMSMNVGEALVIGASEQFTEVNPQVHHFDYTASPSEDMRAEGGLGAAVATTRYGTKSQRESREVREKDRFDKVDKNRPQLLFLDEPEHGLDPWRHLKVKEMISSLTTFDSIIIVATNSPILVGDAELPRVDLRFPEDGVTRQVR